MVVARGRAVRIALVLAGALVAALGLAQLLLPGIAAQRVRDELGRYGDVHSATVRAFPAIELLWGHAQSATLSAGSLSMSLAQAAKLLGQARGVEKVDLRAQTMRVGQFAMHDTLTRKRGAALYAEGSVGEADLRAAVPGSVEVQPLGSVSGGVAVRVSGTLFGVAGSIEALLSIQEGKLVAQPQGIPFGGFVKLTLLSDPNIYLQGFDLTTPAAARGGPGGEPSYRARIWATLR
jgi:hypothetical protein